VLDRIRAWAGTDDVQLLEAPPGGGYSNELVYVSIAGEAKVIRLAPSGPPLFPSYDLAMQVAVQEVAAAAGVPVPAPLAAELDPSVLGRPFLVMPRIDGRHPGEAPMLTPWILELSSEEQRRLQGGFLDALAAVHRVDPPGDLRPWSAELDWWASYATWAAEGQADPAALVALFDRCRAAAPTTFPPSVLLWGDVRMGNVVVADDLSVAAVLDWEMASAGPPECDLAWYTALNGLTLSFVGDDAPGFRTRDEVVAHHEAALGRPMESMAWHEAFALCRAAAAQFRVDVVKALVKDRPPPDPATHLMVENAAESLDSLG
jgi:aminoglycoside phosphotransferase (APT) family kinase protein